MGENLTDRWRDLGNQRLVVPLVVALGKVDSALVQAELGPNLTLVVDPTADDLEQAVGAIVRAAPVVDVAAFDSMPNLRVLARTGVGTEKVDLAEASKRGIPVVITPGSNTNAVAEGALAFILHLSKRLAPLTDLVREGRWHERDGLPLGDIEGATCGIIGFGRIGRRLAEVLTVMGARVLAFDPFAEIPEAMRVDSLEALLAQSNIVSLHAPLTQDNHGLLSRSTLALLPKGAIVVNCSRGPLLNLDDALEALNSGQLLGLGLDVFDDEPPAHHPLFDHPAVALTPHVMGLSQRAAAQTFVDAARGIRAVLEGREPFAKAN